MGTRYSLPFRTILSGVDLGLWHLKDVQGDMIHVGKEIHAWDYESQLNFARTASLSGRQIFSACGLPDTADLRLVVTVQCNRSRFRDVVFRSDQLEPVDASVSIEFSVDSSALAEQITIDTEIVLVRGSSKVRPFVARLSGSRLYRDSVAVDLEGSGSRMPTEMASFPQRLPWIRSPRAAWYVSCGACDLHAPVMRELRVYINESEFAFADACNRGDSIVVSLIGADIARRLITTAIADPAFIENMADYPVGSIGEAAARLISVCFEGMSAADVRALSEGDRGRFDAMLQSAMNVTRHEQDVSVSAPPA